MFRCFIGVGFLFALSVLSHSFCTCRDSDDAPPKKIVRPTFLNSLPPELQELVLERLTRKALLELRRVNRATQDCVDRFLRHKTTLMLDTLSPDPRTPFFFPLIDVDKTGNPVPRKGALSAALVKKSRAALLGVLKKVCDGQVLRLFARGGSRFSSEVWAPLFPTVRCVTLWNMTLDDSFFAALSQMRALEYLELKSCRFPCSNPPKDVEMASPHELKNLRALIVVSSKIDLLVLDRFFQLIDLRNGLPFLKLKQVHLLNKHVDISTGSLLKRILCRALRDRIIGVLDLGFDTLTHEGIEGLTWALHRAHIRIGLLDVTRTWPMSPLSIPPNIEHVKYDG